MSNFVNPTFHLNTKKHPKLGQFPIYCRLWLNGKKSEFVTGIYIEEKKWDAEHGQPIREPLKTTELIKIFDDLVSLQKQLIRDGLPVDAKVLKSRYLNQYTGKEVTHLLSYLQKIIHRLEKSADHIHQTVQHYRTMKNHVQNFLVYTGKSASIPLTDVDYSFLKDFQEYLLTVKNYDLEKIPLNKGTSNKYLAKFRVVMEEARKEGVIDRNPFENLKRSDTYKNKRVFLNENEIEKIVDLDVAESNALARVKDIFLFAIYSGLRVSDLRKLKTEYIYVDNEGDTVLEIYQHKTDEFVKIPLEQKALDILSKHKEHAEITGQPLPMIVEQKINYHLKEIARKAHINKKVTMHTARHTAAVRWLNMGYGIETVQRLLGHSDIRTTMVYAVVTNKKVKDEFRRINQGA